MNAFTQPSKSSKYLITIDGVDGTGKSTIGKLLASQLGFTYATTPLPQYAQLRKLIDENPEDVFSRFLFYYSATYHSVRYLLENTDAPGLVLDRYILSTRYYHEILLGYSLEPFFRMVPFPVPDASIIVTASPAVLLQRLSNRSQLNYIEKRIDLLEQIQKKFMESDNTIIVMNNGEKQPEEIVSGIIQKIENQQKQGRHYELQNGSY